MARAEQFVPPPINPPTEIRLTLSQDEARILYLLTGRVGGAKEGWRGETTAIYHALDKVVTNPLEAKDVMVSPFASIQFKNTKE